MIKATNHSIQRMGASRLGLFQLVCQRRLAPTADADRWPLIEQLLTFLKPQQPLILSAQSVSLPPCARG
jgi:hypothetical protein